MLLGIEEWKSDGVLENFAKIKEDFECQQKMNRPVGFQAFTQPTV